MEVKNVRVYRSGLSPFLSYLSFKKTLAHPGAS